MEIVEIRVFHKYSGTIKTAYTIKHGDKYLKTGWMSYISHTLPFTFDINDRAIYFVKASVEYALREAQCRILPPSLGIFFSEENP